MAGRLIDKVLGRYKILSEIDKGGMGRVYRAQHIFTHKEVALKTLLMGWLSDKEEHERKEIEERFRREAQAAAQIAHENVVEIYDFDVAKENTPAYIAMEFIRGESLAKILKSKGKLSFKKALPLMIQISDGIAEAHKKGFIHRDLKPANIMIIPSADNIKRDRVKIVDFGIAKVFNSDLTGITRVGQELGSPTHMAPEQWTALNVDERADVYSLGLIFYELLSGIMPFQSDNRHGWYLCHIEDPPKPMPDDIPKDIAQIISQCLEKQPEQRPKSAIELRDKLVKVEKYIQKQEKERENQSTERIKSELRKSVETLEKYVELVKNYKKKLDLNAYEINRLNEENINLKQKNVELNKKLSGELPSFDNGKIKHAINAIGYELIGNLNNKAVLVPLENNKVVSTPLEIANLSKSFSWFDDLKHTLKQV